MFSVLIRSYTYQHYALLFSAFRSNDQRIIRRFYLPIDDTTPRYIWLQDVEAEQIKS